MTPDLKIIAIDCAKGRGIILPGGKVERGESPSEGCLRELREETGLRGVKAKALMKVMDGDVPVYVYVVKVTNYNHLPETREGRVLRATYEQLRESVYGPHYEVIFKRFATGLLG